MVDPPVVYRYSCKYLSEHSYNIVIQGVFYSLFLLNCVMVDLCPGFSYKLCTLISLIFYFSGLSTMSVPNILGVRETFCERALLVV